MQVQDFVLNALTGTGTAKDRLTANKFGLRVVDAGELMALYRCDWLARKIIDIIPEDMTRAWRTWQAKDTQVTQIEDAEKVFGLRSKVALAMQWARLFGGAAILIGFGDSDPTQPAAMEAVTRGSLRYLHVFNRWEITAGQLIMDPENGFFGEPEYYEIAGAASQVRIHPSRVIRFVGAAYPDRKTANDGWGDSILQVVYDAVMAASGSQQQVASLLPEAKVDVISVPGLSEALSTKEGAERVAARFTAAAMIKSMHNTLLLEGNGKPGEGETWQQKAIRFTEFPDLLRMFLQVASGAADIPVTRLLGQSPTGLNATGDSDIRNYYDHVSSKQEVDLKPALMRLDEVLIRHALGRRPKQIWYDWNPLWQLSDVERADIALKRAQTTDYYAANNGIPAAVLQAAVRAQAIENGDYPGIEHLYAEYDFGVLLPPSGAPLSPKKSVGDPAARTAVGDARMPVRGAYVRTLYVNRRVTNAAAIIKWAKSQGFKTTLKASDLHVTIAFSREPIDWFKAWVAESSIEIGEGGPRVLAVFGEGAIVLQFASDTLQWRWQQFRDIGASWDWPEYQPHLTISYDAGDVDLTKIEPYRGPIKLGPEIFAEVDENWRAKVQEA